MPDALFAFSFGLACTLVDSPEEGEVEETDEQEHEASDDGVVQVQLHHPLLVRVQNSGTKPKNTQIHSATKTLQPWNQLTRSLQYYCTFEKWALFLVTHQPYPP